MNEGDVYLADCATTHTILQDKRYFLDLTLTNANVSTIFGTANLIEGFRRATIMLPNGTRFHINDACNIECLYITSIVYDKKLVMEKLSVFASRLYHTNIKHIESYVAVNQKFNDPKTFVLWHD